MAYQFYLQKNIVPILLFAIFNYIYCSGNDKIPKSCSKSEGTTTFQNKSNSNKNNPVKSEDSVMKSTEHCSIPDGDSILRQMGTYLKQHSVEFESISLPFPSEWPVKDQIKIRFYCFNSNSLNTGSNMKELYVSSHTVVVQCDKRTGLSLSLIKTEKLDLGKVAARNPDLKDNLFSNATELMFRYVFNNNRDEHVVNELRKSYQMWLLSNPFKRDYIKQYSNDFITWLLDEKAGVTINYTNDRQKYLTEDDFKLD